MQDLRLACLQLDLVWQDWVANTQKIDGLLSSLQSEVDVIVLPEMFGSGFTMQPAAVAQSMTGPAVEWLKNTSQQYAAACIGSLVIEDEGQYYNRLLVMHPDGSMHHYDKRHLFTYAGEHEAYTRGNHKLIVTIKGWRICPLVCYDLRFPVWSRNDLGYDVLIYVANWPRPRIEAWRTLLSARAIENLSYCVGVNRVGVDALDNKYIGSSCVFDVGGHLLHQASADEEIFEARLNYSELQNFRAAYNFLADKDSYTIL